MCYIGTNKKSFFMTKKVCPTCGSESLEEIPPEEDLVVGGFRCGTGHTFMKPKTINLEDNIPVPVSQGGNGE